MKNWKLLIQAHGRTMQERAAFTSQRIRMGQADRIRIAAELIVRARPRVLTDAGLLALRETPSKRRLLARSLNAARFALRQGQDERVVEKTVQMLEEVVRVHLEESARALAV